MPQAALTYLALSLVFIVILLFYVNRVVSRLKKSDDDMKKDTTEVGFVVDTFHDLVNTLKEKERELETLKKKAEERASAIETYNEDILQSVPSGVVSFDEGLTITKMNSAAEKILGIREIECVGKPYYEHINSPLTEYIRGGANTGRTETSYLTGSGKRIWLGLNISPLKDSSGKTIGRILVFTDLTELKAYQTRTELRERLSNLGEMSAGIAHELRNPMAVISGYTKILSKKIDVSLLSAVEAISKEIAVMDRIITDFLAFAKPDELVPARVDIAGLVRECIDSTVGHGPIKVVAEIDAVPPVTADEVLIRQSICNLLGNAVDSMKDGGVLTVKVRLQDTLLISVSDTGHGIPGGIADKIYLPFFTTKERGTGLGLSIVHKVVVSHGGSISLSTGDTGSTFTISLPKSLIVSV
ncbi:MAG: PAS domain-containing protein [Nitrospirae bacterium]|nr:PAS domain-containing protein [Nitrospirota bacterium]